MRREDLPYDHRWRLWWRPPCSQTHGRPWGLGQGPWSPPAAALLTQEPGKHQHTPEQALLCEGSICSCSLVASLKPGVSPSCWGGAPWHWAALHGEGWESSVAGRHRLRLLAFLSLVGRCRVGRARATFPADRRAGSQAPCLVPGVVTWSSVAPSTESGPDIPITALKGCWSGQC